MNIILIMGPVLPLVQQNSLLGMKEVQDIAILRAQVQILYFGMVHALLLVVIHTLQDHLLGKISAKIHVMLDQNIFIKMEVVKLIVILPILRLHLRGTTNVIALALVLIS